MIMTPAIAVSVELVQVFFLGKFDDHSTLNEEFCIFSSKLRNLP